MPRYVIQGQSIHSLLILVLHGSIELIESAVIYSVQSFSHTLALVPLGDGFISALTGFFFTVRVVLARQGHKKIPTYFFYDKV
jgi:hypothetical protein